nr:hypothetical protein CFP56_25845 [Quercus suber]
MCCRSLLPPCHTQGCTIKLFEERLRRSSSRCLARRKSRQARAYITTPFESKFRNTSLPEFYCSWTAIISHSFWLLLSQPSASRLVAHLPTRSREEPSVLRRLECIRETTEVSSSIDCQSVRVWAQHCTGPGLVQKSRATCLCLIGSTRASRSHQISRIIATLPEFSLTFDHAARGRIRSVYSGGLLAQKTGVDLRCNKKATDARSGPACSSWTKIKR